MTISRNAVCRSLFVHTILGALKYTPLYKAKEYESKKNNDKRPLNDEMKLSPKEFFDKYHLGNERGDI